MNRNLCSIAYYSMYMHTFMYIGTSTLQVLAVQYSDSSVCTLVCMHIYCATCVCYATIMAILVFWNVCS